MPSRLKHSNKSTKRRERLVEICKKLPKVEVEAAGEQHLAYRIQKKTFAYYLFDHHGDGRVAFCCKAVLGVQRDLVERDPERFFVPPYLGPKGWIAIRLDLAEIDWGLIVAFAKKAYQQVAPRKLAAEAG